MRARGFTLLEVMVAVAILGLSLTVILSAQAGLYSGGDERAAHQRGHRARALPYDRNRGAPDQARVPVGRRERRRAVLRRRLRGKTCAAAGASKLSSSLSQAASRCRSSALGRDWDSSLGLTAASRRSWAQRPGSLAARASSTSSPETLRASRLPTAASPASPRRIASRDGRVEGLAQMVMGFVYPQLKPMLEASIRKVTVKVTWHEGHPRSRICHRTVRDPPHAGGSGPRRRRRRSRLARQGHAGRALRSLK